MSMEDEVEHHSQAISQSTMSFEISRSTVPPKKDTTVSIKQQPESHVDEKAVDARKKWYEDMRGWIMVIAVLVTSVTYTSGLSPPGGFWQDDNGNHKAGSAILQDRFRARYTTFFYANATAFMTSLIIIILLMSEDYYNNTSKVIMLYFSMVLDLISLMIAYAAGCGRSVSISIYVIVLGAVVLLIVVYLARVLTKICKFAAELCPRIKCIGRLSELVGGRSNKA